MKKYILICFISIQMWSQNGGFVSQTVQNLVKQNVVFKTFDIFTVQQNIKNFEYKKATDSATIVVLNKNLVNQIVAEKNQYLKVKFPYMNKQLEVLLYKVDILAQGFHLETSDGNKNHNLETGVHYRGILSDEDNSVVSFNFFQNQMSAVVSSGKRSNIVIGKLEISNNTTDYIIYPDASLKDLKGFECFSKEAEEAETASRNGLETQSINSLRCVTMYFEIGYSLYQANGSSTNQTNIWLNSLFNNVQTLFDNDTISIALKSVFIWTAVDPYNGTSSGANVTLFQQNRPIFDGDLPQLLIIKGGQGGVAQGINRICKQDNYSFSDVFFSYNTVPTYSWTVNVISHEFGHLMGSQHTHGCYWNNNNTAIDGCGPTASVNYTEGSCPTGPVPTTTVKGTIMSYCHLISGVGVNFANGFGPLPKARILQRVNAGTCLSTDCINTCISLIYDVKAQNITNTSASIGWIDQNASNTQWEISVNSYPFTVASWTTVTTNPVILSNLQPNTYYSFSIRPKCDPITIATTKRAIFATTDNFCGGKIFTDSGGLTNDYGDLETFTRVILPNNSTDKIKVSFTSFDLENDYDYLYIYNGNSTTSPILTPGGLTGQVTPPDFESTASNGALTFKFESDPFVTGAGWNATLNCLTLSSTSNDYLDFKYSFNQKTQQLQITSPDMISNSIVYSIDGKRLLEDKTSKQNPVIDFSGCSSGVYIVKVNIQDKFITLKINKL
jgi:hypothetical protein